MTLNFNSTISNFCPINATPLDLTGFLRNWLTQHFSSAENITIAALKNKIWKSTDDTAILIEPIHRWKPTLTEKRPGIIIKREDQQGQQIGIGNQLMGGSPVSDNQDKSFLVQGSHTLLCIGGEDGEAELLGAEVFSEVGKYCNLIAKQLGFAKINLPVMGGLVKLKEARENFLVPVRFNYSYWMTWKITTLDTGLIRKINLTSN